MAIFISNFQDFRYVEENQKFSKMEHIYLRVYVYEISKFSKLEHIIAICRRNSEILKNGTPTAMGIIKKFRLKKDY